MIKKINSTGFTLIELMVVILMIAILAGVGIPRFNTWLPVYRLKGAASDIQSNLQRARVLAIKENRTVQVRFDNSISPGFYYFDMDSDGAPDADEYRVDLSSYGSGVDFGTGSAVNDWSTPSVAIGSAMPAGPISFGSRGTSNQDSVFLQNMNAMVCYAITTSIAGTSRVRFFNGTTWN